MTVTTDLTRTAGDLAVGVKTNPGTYISSQHSYDALEVDTVEVSDDGLRRVITGLYRTTGKVGSETWDAKARVTLTYDPPRPEGEATVSDEPSGAGEYRIVFTVPAEVVVTLHGDTEDEAYDRAVEAASEYLDTLSVASSTNVAVNLSIDGIGADSVNRT